MSEKLKGIHKVRRKTATGWNVHYYDRVTGIKLRGVYGSPEFIADLNKARQQAGSKEEGTLAELMRCYLSSKAFRKTAPSTQRAYKYTLNRIDKLWGTIPLKAIESVKFRQMIEEWAEKQAISEPKGVDNVTVCLGMMMKEGVAKGKIERNVLAAFPKFYKSDRSEKIWTPENVARFISYAPKELHQVMIVALYSGQRRGDIMALQWSQYDGEGISIIQEKTKRRVYVPCVRPLKLMLDEIRQDTGPILKQANGRPWKGTTLNKAWLQTCKKAGIEGLHFHDLRGTAVTRLAEAGCEVAEIASITGHSLNSCHNILAVYMAMTKKLARNAMAKLEANL